MTTTKLSDMMHATIVVTIATRLAIGSCGQTYMQGCCNRSYTRITARVQA